MAEKFELDLSTHGRYGYSAIVNRPSYNWPEGRRLAVYIGLNLEHFAFGEGLGAELAPGGPQPDVLNYAWRDYGNRVGVWRLLSLFDALGLPVALLVNSTLYNYCPEVISAFRDRNDEIVAHGRTNTERQSILSEAAETALIRETTDIITQHEGKTPQGWLGPWIAQSPLTPDLLQETGYAYLLDWCCDDQPIWFKTRQSRILAVPYSQEINDIPAIAVRRTSASDFADMIIDQYEEMKQQSQEQPLVYGIALHAYIVGQPFRLRHLRRALTHIAKDAAQHSDVVWLTHPGQIAQHIASLPEGIVP
ncbi:polysaccharide deacetylase family protein [Leptolyngbya cf. ectocarpi LEGE 11479]|uniref:Polysaccharide deacetylase family protein n=2 Tax=Leptolyngbya ectocarpi TaxID=1202 RepID=A0A929F9E8_LEPEC|nr:polysaccharide deacetylase family protein [Leptolyngbya cf. ectocarpi LEGE 11479]